MSVKLKELKDDALIDVQVNKSYYFMVKLELFNAVERIISENPEEAKDLENIITKKYDELSVLQRTIYTLSLLVAEIERVAMEKGLFVEVDPKDITED
jgi:hypothetical protein